MATVGQKNIVHHATITEEWIIALANKINRIFVHSTNFVGFALPWSLLMEFYPLNFENGAKFKTTPSNVSILEC